MDRRHRQRVWKSRTDQEIRFRCGRLLYEKGEFGSRLSEIEFACAFERDVFAAGARWNGVRFWLAHAIGDAENGGARGALFSGFEVIVVFPQRIRVARSSTRLCLRGRAWKVSVTEVPAMGTSLKGFFAGQLPRFSSRKRSCFVGGDSSDLFHDGALEVLCSAKTVEHFDTPVAEIAQSHAAASTTPRPGGQCLCSLEELAAEVNSLRRLVGLFDG